MGCVFLSVEQGRPLAPAPIQQPLYGYFPDPSCLPSKVSTRAVTWTGSLLHGPNENSTIRPYGGFGSIGRPGIRLRGIFASDRTSQAEDFTWLFTGNAGPASPKPPAYTRTALGSSLSSVELVLFFVVPQLS